MLISNRVFSVFRTSARGMEAQRIALGAASENIANATTSRTADGQPYALKRAVQTAPDQTSARFGDVLVRADLEMERTDPRHMEGNELNAHLEGGDLGPTTQIQEEVRLRAEYDPTHPNADAQGYVYYPDVNIVEEMSRMISANRLYEANLSVVQAAKEMVKRSLEI
ncbi:MAG TPA: flagellar basal body rod protein FlgC [Rhodothermales bacterium]|nr:flagellar basal body rod protein FlgC [Rhodothermales bacterium]